jgi:hypothetical protein
MYSSFTTEQMYWLFCPSVQTFPFLFFFGPQGLERLVIMTSLAVLLFVVCLILTFLALSSSYSLSSSPTNG